MSEIVRRGVDIRRSWVPASVAAVLSLIPGLGQIAARRPGRGLMILASAGTIIGLLAWRVMDLARREPDFVSAFLHAIGRRPVFVLSVVLSLAAMWIVNMVDAHRCAATGRKGGPAVFLLISLAFFSLGWQISRIDPVRLVADFPSAMAPLSRVMWPWEAAVRFPTEEITAQTAIAEGAAEDAPPLSTEVPGEPFIQVTPNYGRMSTRDDDHQAVSGSRVRVVGRSFEANTPTGIFWIDPIGNEFQLREQGEALEVMTDDTGSFEVEFTMPYRLTSATERGVQIHQIEARQTFRLARPVPSEALLVTIARMIETIFMGMMATVFGIVLSVPVSFLAARNIMAGSRLTLAVYYIVRAILNIIRSVEPLIWALIAVVWVGLGPFAGIVALTLHSVAALGKLYSEAIEGIDHGPIEAVQATGATKLQTIMYAVVPQMISPFISFSIYRWDINVRMSTVIGLVGGGGVGFILVQYIRLLDYRSAGIAVWFIAITVALLDYVSAEIRNKLV